MQALQNISQLKQLKKSTLPTRVIEEVFPICEAHITKTQHIAIGVSSGVDSMCLSSLLILRFHQKKYPLSHIHIMHCNHKIREQSEIEEQYIQKFFEGTNIHIFHRNKKEKSDENSLRERRYKCFTTPFRKGGSPKDRGILGKRGRFLFLGHHLEDRIESTFLNCIRGAGLQGFLNMKIIQKHQLLPTGKVCRPLLNITKREILTFCKKYKIRYFEDETNSDISTSQRNYIRKEIVGKLVSMNRGKSKFLGSMKQIYKEIQMGDRDAYTPPYEGGQGGSDKTKSHPNNNAILQPIPNVPSRKAEFSYLWKKDLTTLQPQDLLQLREQLNISYNLTNAKIQERYQRITKKQKGRKELKKVHFLFHEQQLYIIKAQKKFWEQHIPAQQTIKKPGPQTIAGITIEIQEERLLGTTLRFPQPGDTFNGKTRNRRALNQKIPAFRRNFIPLAVKDGNIIHMRKNIRNTPYFQL